MNCLKCNKNRMLDLQDESKATFFFCYGCNSLFIKTDGKIRELKLESINKKYKMDFYPEESSVTEDKISMYIGASRDENYETPEEKDNRLISHAVSLFTCKNTYDLYTPYKIGRNKWVILGEINGIFLRQEDDAVMIIQLHEDDGNWFVSKGTTTSAYWVQDYQKVLEATYAFLEGEHFVKVQYGYQFKGKQTKGK